MNRFRADSHKANLTNRQSTIQSQNKNSFHNTPKSAYAILNLQQTAGNQAVQRLFDAGAIQTKLKIGQPGDKYELEADRIAESVMRMPDSVCPSCVDEGVVQRRMDEEEKKKEEEFIQPKPISEQITPLAQRQVEDTERKRREEEMFQAKEKSPGGIKANTYVETSIENLRGKGEPLPESVRNYFEPRFGYDFSGVRVHTGSEAAEAAKSINARAFTVGNDVVFGSSDYSPETEGGKKLLAHELTHVVQQDRMSSKYRSSTLQRQPRRASIESHVVTKDRKWSGGLGAAKHSSLGRFKRAIMKRKTRSRWTLWFGMHGWNGVVTYHEECTPPGGKLRKGTSFCIPGAEFQRIFNDDAKWVAWRKEFGPTRVDLYVCHLNSQMTKIVENTLKRSGRKWSRTQSERSTFCKIERYYHPKKKYCIRTYPEYRRLSATKKKEFDIELRSYRNWGYGHVDTTMMNDQQLRHYFFNEPPKGWWVVWTITYKRPGGWTIPYFKFIPSSRYAEDCWHGVRP